MIDKLRERRENEEGFTLIELMVVVLIIAILLAIAIPTFLGARNRANDRASQASLRNALTAAKVVFTDAQDYQQATISKLGEEEPALSFDTAPSTGPKEVTVEDPPAVANEWYATSFSKSGKCFHIKDNSAAAPTGDGTTFAVVDGVDAATGCSIDKTLTYTADGWD
jgi:type IV pilus assembly protein PilA